PDLTKATFKVALDATPGVRYLRTGDLGFFHHERLFITGRLKDLIIVNGRNLYPIDLESAVEHCYSDFGSGGCAEFSLEPADGERLVIAQEVEHRKEFDADAAATAIRTHIADQYEAPVWGVIFVRSGAIPRTSSGKVQRQACRQAYLNHSLPIIASCLPV